MADRSDAIRNRHQQEQRGTSDRGWYVDGEKLEEFGIESWKASEGNNYIAIIPPHVADRYFGEEIYVHYDVGVRGSALLCPSMMKRKYCPICAERKRLQSKGVADEDTLKQLRYSRRWLYFIVDMRDDETEAKGIQLYDGPPTIDKAILALSTDPRDPENGPVKDISHQEEGYTLIFKREGTALNTKYSAFVLEKFTEPLKDEWLEQVPEFEEILVWMSADEIEEEFKGAADPEPKHQAEAPEEDDVEVRTYDTDEEPEAEDKSQEEKVNEVKDKVRKRSSRRGR